MGRPIHNYMPNYDKRITLRLSEKQFEYIISASEKIGKTPSDFIRLLIDSSYRKNKGEECHENVKTDFNYKL